MRCVQLRIDPLLGEILGRLDGTPRGKALLERLTRLIETTPGSPVEDELVTTLRAQQWVLEHAAEGGLPLTAAGHHMPGDVVALAEVLATT